MCGTLPRLQVGHQGGGGTFSITGSIRSKLAFGGRAREFLQAMLKGELDEVLARSWYALAWQAVERRFGATAWSLPGIRATSWRNTMHRGFSSRCRPRKMAVLYTRRDCIKILFVSSVLMPNTGSTAVHR